MELHLPGYNYCGPNTDLKRRLERGDDAINELDEACKEHDIGYSNHADLRSRIALDRRLVLKAYARAKADDADADERICAWIVVTAMCAKLQLTTTYDHVFSG